MLTAYFLSVYYWKHFGNRYQVDKQFHKCWIYLTHWGYEVLVCKTVLEFLMIVARFFSENQFKLKGRKPFLHETNHFLNKLLWLLNTMAYSTAVMISTSYWCFLYPSSAPLDTPEEKFGNYNVHLVQVGLVLFHVLCDN